MTKKCPFCCTTQKGHGIRIFRVPWPIPRGLLVLIPGRSSDSKVIASYPFPFHVQSHFFSSNARHIRNSGIHKTLSYYSDEIVQDLHLFPFSHMQYPKSQIPIHTWNQVTASLTYFLLRCKSKNPNVVRYLFPWKYTILEQNWLTSLSQLI